MEIKVLLWDTPTDMCRYEEYIREISHSDNIIILKVAGSDPEAFLYKHNAHIMVADLATQKESKNKLINAFKNKNPYTKFICIGNKNVALDAWNCGCTDYILKPVTKEKLQISTMNAIKEIEKEKLYQNAMKKFMVRSGDYWLLLKYDEILYFEKLNKKIKVKAKKGEYEFYCSFEKLRNMIDMDYFLQCHQGYIVNRYKMLYMSNDAIYLDESDIPIPVSRRLKKNIMGILEVENRP